MEKQNPKSLSFPDEWKPCFYLYVIGSNEMLITQEERNNILKAMSQGDKFIQLRAYTIMVNSIQMIRPRYEPNNVPPRPKEDVRVMTFPVEGGYEKVSEVRNKDLIELWERTFNKSLVIL